MGMLETITQLISEKIARNLGYNDDQREIIAYGAFALFHTAFTTMVILLAGFTVKAFIPTIILCIVSPVLRKFTGGAHCTSANRCAVASVVIFISFALVIQIAAVYTSSLVYLALFSASIFVSVILTLKYSPVDSPSKPIKREETRIRLRKGALSFIGMCTFLVLILNFFLPNSYELFIRQISLSIGIGLIWQSITLTPVGHGFIYRLDHVLRYIIKS